jgi:hypothetical protein
MIEKILTYGMLPEKMPEGRMTYQEILPYGLVFNALVIGGILLYLYKDEIKHRIDKVILG